MSMIGIDFLKMPEYVRVETVDGFVTRLCRQCFLRHAKVGSTSTTSEENLSMAQFLANSGTITEATSLWWVSWEIATILPCEPDQIFCRICNIDQVIALSVKDPDSQGPFFCDGIHCSVH